MITFKIHPILYGKGWVGDGEGWVGLLVVIIGMEQNKGEIFIEEIMSSEESAQKPLHEIQLGLKVEAGKDSEEEWSNATFYRIVARRIGCNLEWQLFRKYEDFQWLFKALKSRFPGRILPYFPSPSIQNYLEHKTKNLNLRLRKHLFAPRQQQLSNFLTAVCGSRILGVAEEVQVFLLRGEEFQLKRGALGRLGPQSQTTSKSFSIYSFFSKGFSWLTSGKEEKHETSNELLRIRCHLSEYSSQIAFLLQKFSEFVDLKITEMGWNGGSTQIDSVEVLKAKFLSSRPFGQQLVNEIQSRLIVPIVEEFKKEGQLQEQIGERVEAGRMAEYLRSVEDGSGKGPQLAAQIQQFDRTMLQQWPIQEQSWREVVGELDNRFRAIWLQYSVKMGRIWR